LNAGNNASAIQRLAIVCSVELQDESFDWHVDLVFLLGFTEVEAPLHSFQTLLACEFGPSKWSVLQPHDVKIKLFSVVRSNK
jgi:hypothetical protein